MLVESSNDADENASVLVVPGPTVIKRLHEMPQQLCYCYRTVHTVVCTTCIARSVCWSVDYILAGAVCEECMM